MTDSERYDLMIDEIDSLKMENKALQEQITAKETTLGGTYIDINTHFRDTEKLKSENTALKAKLDKAVDDMTTMANSMREYAETDTACCFACKYDTDFSITGSGDYANECPGFDKGDCFEWRGVETE